MRLTRKVFLDLAIWMVGFGLFIGFIFPFFVTLIGIPADYVITPGFFTTCLIAGCIVGIINVLLAKRTIGRRLRILIQSMKKVQENLDDAMMNDEVERCKTDDFYIEVNSDDEIGESAASFNHLVRSLAESLEMEFAMRTFSEKLSTQLEVKKLADSALKLMLQHTSCQAGVIFIEMDNEMTVAASYSVRSPESLIRNDVVRSCLKSGSQQIHHSLEGGEEGILTSGSAIQDVLFEPILYQECVLGLIVLFSETGFKKEQLVRMNHFRQSFAPCLQNALSHERLQQIAALDPLTGVYNRRFGLARLKEEFNRSVRMEIPLGVLIYDLDHFKNVNDRYGHLTGDHVLTQVTRMARGVIRHEDVLIRYGGEEFMVVLPAASISDVSQIAERIRRRVSEMVFETAGTPFGITISLGVTSYPEMNAENETELVNLADEALYQAKEAGRNRVMDRSKGE